MNATYIFLLSTIAPETGFGSFLERIGIAAVRRVRILYRILEGPGVLGLSASSCLSISLIDLGCLPSIETVPPTCSSRCSVVRLRLVDYLAFAVPIAAIALPIAYSPVAVFVPYMFRYYSILGRGLLYNQRASL